MIKTNPSLLSLPNGSASSEYKYDPGPIEQGTGHSLARLLFKRDPICALDGHSAPLIDPSDPLFVDDVMINTCKSFFHGPRARSSKYRLIYYNNFFYLVSDDGHPPIMGPWEMCDLNYFIQLFKFIRHLKNITGVFRSLINSIDQRPS